jgi:hypothetical protein
VFYLHFDPEVHDESRSRILASIEGGYGGRAGSDHRGRGPSGDERHFSKPGDLLMLMLSKLPGRERTAAEYSTLLDAAGFTLDRIVPTSTPYSLVEAAPR